MAIPSVNDMGQTSAEKQRTFRKKMREDGYKTVNIYVDPSTFAIIENANGYSRADRVMRICQEWQGQPATIDIDAELLNIQQLLRAFSDKHSSLGNHEDLQTVTEAVALLRGKLEARREGNS